MSDNAKISFDSYFNEIATTFDKSDGKNREKTLEELAKTRVNGKLLGKVGAAAVSKYGEFKLVGDDLSKMIGYIKLDKGLPKNADANRKLMDDISSFKDLAFTTSRLTDRKLNQHRVGVAKDEGKIFRKQLLTSNKTVLDLIDKTSKLTSNAFQFKKKAAESVMKIIAQKQIKNAPKNVGEFIYSFAEKIKSLKTFNSTGEYDITVDTDARTNSNVKNMYNISKASPLMTNREAVTAYSGSTDAAVLDKYEPLLAKYEEAVNDVSEMDKFADNKFIEYTQVVEQEDGTSLLRLDPKFKVTTQVTQDVKDGFLEIQKNDPALAQEIVNYQLYRHVVNNKIGSFIDVLPKSIDIKQLTDVSEFKESIEDMPSVDAIYAVDEALMDNLIADNKSLLGDVHTSEINSKSIIGEQEFPTSFETDEELGTYVTYNGNIYKKFGSGYTKLGNIQGDENFTAFEQAPISSVEKVVEVKQFPNEYLLTNGTILSLPNNDVSIDLGPKGSYTILPSGEINNDKSGNKVKENTPIYFSIIEQYQEQQANDLNNNCK
jgi:hypothetical protein